MDRNAPSHFPSAYGYYSAYPQNVNIPSVIPASQISYPPHPAYAKPASVADNKVNIPNKKGEKRPKSNGNLKIAKQESGNNSKSFKKILYQIPMLNTPEDIEKWREERRKRYPKTSTAESSNMNLPNCDKNPSIPGYFEPAAIEGILDVLYYIRDRKFMFVIQ